MRRLLISKLRRQQNNSCRSIQRTAGYGPVCPVVWEGRGREAPPYPDCADAAPLTTPELPRQSAGGHLTPGTKKEQCSSYVLISGESDHVADVRGGSGGAGIDCAVHRDDRGLGAGDSAALIGPFPGRPRRAGEKPDDARAARVPRGLGQAKASPLRGESAPLRRR